MTTFAGSLVAVLVASSLAKSFSGSGVVPPAISASPAFLASVSLAAAATVLLATRLGMPVSTTHALLGALVGAGLVAAGSAIHVRALANELVLPLLFSPLLAVALTLALYPIAHSMRRALGIENTSCLCVGHARATAAGTSRALAANGLAVWTGTAPACVDRYEGRVVGIQAQRAFDTLHFLSAGAMSFARGLNVTAA